MKVTPVGSTCGYTLVRAHRLSGQACSCPSCRDRAAAPGQDSVRMAKAALTGQATAALACAILPYMYPNGHFCLPDQAA